MDDAGRLTPRHKWSYQVAAPAFTNIALAVHSQLGERPLKDGQDGKGTAIRMKNFARADTALLKGAFMSIVLEITRGALEIRDLPLAVLGGESMMSTVRKLPEQNVHLDVSSVPRILTFSKGTLEAHMYDTFQFALRATYIAALDAAVNAPWTQFDKLDTTEAVKTTLRVLRMPEFVDNVMEALGGAGFGFLGSDFIRAEIGNYKLLDRAQYYSGSPVPDRGSGYIVKWVEREGRQTPELNEDLARACRMTMALDSRGRHPHRFESGTDGGSSGCPVRHKMASLNGQPISGIGLTVDICARALEQVLQTPFVLATRASSYGIV